MRNIFFIWWVMAAGVCAAQEQAANVPAAQAAPSDALPDLSSLRNPFVPVIPPPKIVETPVEQPVRKVDNIITVPQAPPQRRPPVPPPSLSIQGIVWGGDRPQAIIGGKVVGVGDTVQGVKIVSIRKSGIDVLSGGRKFHVPVD